MAFSKEFIKKIRDCGIHEYAAQFTDLLKVGNMYSGRCPHPDHDDNTPSFKIFASNDKGETYENFACMGCGYFGKKEDARPYSGNDNIAFVRWMSDHKNSGRVLSFVEAVTELAKFYNIPLEYDKFYIVYNENKQLAYKHHKNLLENNKIEVLTYLQHRGMDIADIIKWGIGYDNNRITFPIKDSSSNVVGFSNRAFSKASIDSGQKYKNTHNSESFNKSKVLYGIQYFNNTRKHILLTEGQIDTIMAHKYGVDFAVAPMTCHLSDYHIEHIKKIDKIPILCFDNDKAGLDGMADSAKRLRKAGVKVIKYLPLPPGMDLADVANLQKDNLINYLNENVCLYSQYEINKLLDRFDSGVNELLMSTVPSINALINEIDNDVEKKIIRSFVNKRLHLWKDDDIICL